jgi:glycerate kinase
VKVLVAPCSFKGSLSPTEAARAIDAGFREGFPGAATRCLPIADGGEGTLEVLGAAGLSRASARTLDALGRTVPAEIGFFPDGSAVVESAQACGLWRLAREERDPMRASSVGVGMLLDAALARGARRLLVGLGGSATVDGGLGMLEALGARALDGAGVPVPRGGAGLARLQHLDLAPVRARLRGVDLVALCDVLSPLLGPRGARMYMAQKGVSPAEEDALEAGLVRLAEVALRDYGLDLRDLAGAGAAGGLGAALALCGARLVSGGEAVLDALGVREAVAGSDLVLGGEGRVDEQTLAGKAIAALAGATRAVRRPLLVFCGSVGAGREALARAGITAVFPLVRGPVDEEEAIGRASELLRAAAREVGWLAAALGAAL